MSCQFDLQAEIWLGNAEAADILGTPYRFFRPGAAADPSHPTEFDMRGPRFDESGTFDVPDTPPDQTHFEGGADFDTGLQWDQPGNYLFSQPVSLNAQDPTYRKPNGYGKPTWFAVMDGSDLKAGDYFKGDEGTFFIAAMQRLLPILVVECNRTVSILRPQAQTGIGLVGYGGNTEANETLVYAARPCSILQGTKGEKSEANLPGDTTAAWYSVLLPDIGVEIKPDDILEDDRGFRYVVSSNELSDLGFRLSCMTAIP